RGLHGAGDGRSDVLRLLPRHVREHREREDVLGRVFGDGQPRRYAGFESRLQMTGDWIVEADADALLFQRGEDVVAGVHLDDEQVVHRLRLGSLRYRPDRQVGEQLLIVARDRPAGGVPLVEVVQLDV